MKRKAKSSKTVKNVVQGVRTHPDLQGYVGYCLHKVALRLRARIDEKFEPYGLLAPQYGMLKLLKIEGPLTQVELGSYMHIDKATMVRLIDGLEERAWVRRRAVEGDRRANRLELTSAGEKMVAVLEKARSAVEREFFSSLSATDRAHLHRIIGQLMNS